MSIPVLFMQNSDASKELKVQTFETEASQSINQENILLRIYFLGKIEDCTYQNCMYTSKYHKKFQSNKEIMISIHRNNETMNLRKTSTGNNNIM